MSETKWTRGPWLREGRTVYALTQEGWRKGEPVMVNRFSFQVHGGGPAGAPQEEAEAVATLAQAAPSLYDSIEPDALDAIADELAPFDKGGARVAGLRGIAKRQRAALAKARGETQ